MVEKTKKRKATVYPVFVDLLSFPLDFEPVELMGYQIPRKFKILFLMILNTTRLVISLVMILTSLLLVVVQMGMVETS